MIYRDTVDTRFQRVDYKYSLYDERYFIHSTNNREGLEFPQNTPIGPTMLVEWEE